MQSGWTGERRPERKSCDERRFLTAGCWLIRHIVLCLPVNCSPLSSLDTGKTETLPHVRLKARWNALGCPSTLPASTATSALLQDQEGSGRQGIVGAQGGDGKCSARFVPLCVTLQLKRTAVKCSVSIAWYRHTSTMTPRHVWRLRCRYMADFSWICAKTIMGHSCFPLKELFRRIYIILFTINLLVFLLYEYLHVSYCNLHGIM